MSAAHCLPYLGGAVVGRWTLGRGAIIIIYYAKMAADKNMYIKYTQKYKDKKMHDKIID